MQHRTRLFSLAILSLSLSACLSDLEDLTTDTPSAPATEATEVDKAIVLEAPERPNATRPADPPTIDIAVASMQERDRKQRVCMARGHALDSGFYGRVTYRVQVAADGKVIDAQVAESHALTPTAIECLRRAFDGTIYPAPGGNGAVRQVSIGEP